ncbi:MAG: mitochondrial fission ELM1 family protein [Verrucomicrobiota bacterium]
MNRPLVVWRFTDGKPGHESQTLGLVEALSRRVALDLHSLPALSRAGGGLYYFLRRNKDLDGLPAPDLILGAGHRTHLSVLAAQRARRGKSVILMKPSLPTSCFDCCLIPRHDAPKVSENVIETVGVLNPVQAATNALEGKGLFLIGGPSSHFDWDTEAVCEAVASLVEKASAVMWTLTTSRRTPDACEEALKEINLPNLRVVPCAETGSGWVLEHLAQSKSVWVTEDSVSMVFEALTAGARVGLLPVPAKAAGSSRVQASIDHLRKEEWVVDYPASLSAPGAHARPPLDEAERCAALIMERFNLTAEVH